MTLDNTMTILKMIAVWLSGALNLLAFLYLLLLIGYDWSCDWWYTGYTSQMAKGIPALVLSVVIFGLIFVAAKSGSWWRWLILIIVLYAVMLKFISAYDKKLDKFRQWENQWIEERKKAGKCSI